MNNSETIRIPDKCDHEFIIKQKKPYYILQCPTCDRTVNCSKETYKWFKKKSDKIKRSKKN